MMDGDRKSEGSRQVKKKQREEERGGQRRQTEIQRWKRRLAQGLESWGSEVEKEIKTVRGVKGKRQRE